MNMFSVPTPESQRNKIAVGTAGLLLGLVIFFGGLIYYKRNNSGERNDHINLARQMYYPARLKAMCLWPNAQWLNQSASYMEQLASRM